LGKILSVWPNLLKKFNQVYVVTYDLDNMYIVFLLYFFKIISFYLKIMCP